MISGILSRTSGVPGSACTASVREFASTRGCCARAALSAHDNDVTETATTAKRICELRSVSVDCQQSQGALSASNENKISHRWRGGGWLRVEGGISWKVRNRGYQSFAYASSGWLDVMVE